MKRLFLIIAAMFLAGAALSAPASASSNSTSPVSTSPTSYRSTSFAGRAGASPERDTFYLTPQRCSQKGGVDHTGHGWFVTVCNQFKWRVQYDGTGIFTEAVYIDINTDCSKLESDHPIADMTVTMTDHNGHLLRSTNLSDMNDCHAYRTVSLGGNDMYDTPTAWSGTVRVDNDDNYLAFYDCDINANGNPMGCFALPQS
jgi:hypothetical protein